MASQSPIDEPVSEVSEGPKCPRCGSTRLSFTEIIGPVGHVMQMRDELSDLKEDFKDKVAQARSSRPNAVEEACLALSESPEDMLGQLRDGRVKQIRDEYTVARRELLNRFTAPQYKLAVIHCEPCGHVVGTADSPKHRELAVDRLEDRLGRLEQGMIELQRAVLSLHAALTGSMAGVRDQVAAMNARDKSRDDVARLHAAARMIDDLSTGAE